MSVPSRIDAMLRKNASLVIAAVDSVEGNTIRMTLYSQERADWRNNYRAYTARTYARVVKDTRVCYQKEGNKTFSESAFVTGRSSDKGFDFVFKSQKDKAAAVKFFGTDPLAAIKDLEAKNIQKKQQINLRRFERSAARLDDLFKTPIISDDAVLARGNELAPGYMIVKNHIGWCSKCGHESPVTVNHSKQMACPECGKMVKTVCPERVSGNHQYDSYWIIVPDLRNGVQIVSYYRYYQRIFMNEKTVQNGCSELARSVGIRGKNRECWCKSYHDNSWCRGQSPYFVQFAMGCYSAERSDWCERGYVVPDQFKGYLRKLCGKTAKNVPLDFFIDDMNYVWTEEANSFANVLAEDKDAPHVLRALVKSGLKKIADTVSVVGTRSSELKLNVKARNAKNILRLTDRQFNDFMASDRSLDTLKIIRGSNGVLMKTPDLTPYIRYVYDRIPSRAMNAGETFFVPKAVAGKYDYTVTLSVDKDLRVKDTVCVSMDNHLYKRIGSRFYKTTYYGNDRLDAFLLPKDFEACADLHSLRFVPKELLKTNSIRMMLARDTLRSDPNVNNSILAYEIFKKAGFDKVAAEFKKALVGYSKARYLSYGNSDTACSIMRYAEPILSSIGKQKLYKVLQIPRRVFSRIDRKNATLDSLAGIATACGNNPGITMEEVERLKACADVGDGRNFVLIRNRQPICKTLDYIEKNKIHVHEYDAFVQNLIKLGLKLNADTVFPKDFDKEQVKISCAVIDSSSPDKVEAMKRIRDALMSDKRIGKFLKQNTRYLVYVPESPSDLIQESKRLHNCLSSYVDRVAQGNTSVFFIRDADNPDAALYAMEVTNGKRVQLHGINNCSVVKDSPADKFANGFIKVLNAIHFDPKAILQAA